MTYTIDSPLVVGGIGAFHTAEPGKAHTTPYLKVSLAALRTMADSPPSVDKAQGRWIIPSTLPTRSFSEQAKHGAFVYLWADIDAPNAPMARLRDAIDLRVLACRNAEYFTSRSATADKQKFRILIPLANPLSPDLWLRSQVILHLGLKTVGILGDTAVMRHGQLCYLPNRGAFYESLPRRDGVFLDPEKLWAPELAALAEAESRCAAADQARKDARQQAQEARRQAQPQKTATSIIEQFNAAYSVTDVLIEAGYDQRGDDWRHPNSESRNYSCRVFNGRAYTLSPSDPLWSEGRHAHDAFGAFAAIHHGGDARQACKDAVARLGGTK